MLLLFNKQYSSLGHLLRPAKIFGIIFFLKFIKVCKTLSIFKCCYEFGLIFKISEKKSQGHASFVLVFRYEKLIIKDSKRKEKEVHQGNIYVTLPFLLKANPSVYMKVFMKHENIVSFY